MPCVIVKAKQSNLHHKTTITIWLIVRIWCYHNILPSQKR